MSEAPLSPPGPFLVVGLGNPGPAYAGNRHNVGFVIADLLAERVGGRFSRHGRSQAQVCEGRLGGYGGPRVILAKPQSYMNLSGGPVSGLMKFYKVPLQGLIVVHDELDLPYGVIRLKGGGGEGGNNGLKSISQSLGSRDYLRVRFGIGRPPGRKDPADYVLQDFSGAERKELGLYVEDSADAVEAIITKGLEAAQNIHHA
ncbi:MAG: aminoacyl-tRNA hydrolase [Micromonosporaceae bacterium]